MIETKALIEDFNPLIKALNAIGCPPRLSRREDYFSRWQLLHFIFNILVLVTQIVMEFFSRVSTNHTQVLEHFQSAIWYMVLGNYCLVWYLMRHRDCYFLLPFRLMYTPLPASFASPRRRSRIRWFSSLDDDVANSDAGPEQEVFSQLLTVDADHSAFWQSTRQEVALGIRSMMRNYVIGYVILFAAYGAGLFVQPYFDSLTVQIFALFLFVVSLHCALVPVLLFATVCGAHQQMAITLRDHLTHHASLTVPALTDWKDDHADSFQSGSDPDPSRNRASASPVINSPPVSSSSPSSPTFSGPRQTTSNLQRVRTRLAVSPEEKQEGGFQQASENDRDDGMDGVEGVEVRDYLAQPLHQLWSCRNNLSQTSRVYRFYILASTLGLSFSFFVYLVLYLTRLNERGVDFALFWSLFFLVLLILSLAQAAAVTFYYRQILTHLLHWFEGSRHNVVFYYHKALSLLLHSHDDVGFEVLDSPITVELVLRLIYVALSLVFFIISRFIFKF